MKSFVLAIGLLLTVLLSQGQKKFTFWSMALTNAHTDKPFSSFSRLAYSDFHPGIETGTGFNWATHEKHDWFQTIKAGYFYQQWVQHIISLYTEAGYRYKLPRNFIVEAKIGAGYMHAIADSKIYKIDYENGIQNKTYLGRPQGMASFSVDLQKKISKNNTKIFIEYQQRLQFPFVKSYVPLLPYNILMAGISLPIHSKN